MSLEIIQQKINNGEGYLTVRRNGEFLDILKEEKQTEDIYIGLVFLDKEKKEVDISKIKIYRGGESFLIQAKNFNEKNEIIEKQYTKNNYKLVDNKIVLKTEQDYQQEKTLKECQKILNKLQPLISAINSQKIGIDLGLPEEKGILTEKEMKDWLSYISKISKGDLNAEIPEISSTVKLITGM